MLARMLSFFFPVSGSFKLEITLNFGSADK